MPGMDRTGPRGQGPMTGRGLGPCGGGMRQGFARGTGRGRGFGRGFGFAPAQSAPVELSKEEKLKILEADKVDIEAELKEVDKLIEETNKQ